MSTPEHPTPAERAKGIAGTLGIAALLVWTFSHQLQDATVGLLAQHTPGWLKKVFLWTVVVLGAGWALLWFVFAHLALLGGALEGVRNRMRR